MSRGAYTIEIKKTSDNRFLAVMLFSGRSKYDSSAILGPYKTSVNAERSGRLFAKKVGIEVAGIA